MNTKAELKCPSWIVGVLCLAIVGMFFPCITAGEELSRTQEESESGTNAEKNYTSFFVTSASYLNLTGESMNDVYGDQMIYYGQGGEWYHAEKGIRNHLGFKGGMGFFSTDGRAIKEESDWEVDKATLSLTALHFYFSGMYRFSGADHPGFVAPYVGFGIGGFGGVEKLSMEVSKTTANSDMKAGWDNTNLRASFESHVSVGLNLFANREYQGVFEASYLFCGDGASDNGELPQEMVDAGFTEDVLTAVSRPDFNFSGPTVSLGLQW